MFLSMRMATRVRFRSLSTDSVVRLLEKVKQGAISVADAAQSIERAGVLDIQSHTKIDTTRSARCGFPEVVFGEGKTVEQIGDIMTSMASSGLSSVIASRVTPDKGAAVATLMASHTEQTDHILTHFAEASILHYHSPTWVPPKPATPTKVAVLAAGTSDLFVAEEAAVLLELTSGVHVERVYDVGVAGIHRLFQKLPTFEDCQCCIVCAGMDGALPSAVGGLLRAPIIAVPTSVGYGAAFGGIAPLLTMLNSCAPGVAVVNIDNGFGAAVMAHKIVHMLGQEK